LHFRESLWKALLRQEFEIFALAPSDEYEGVLRENGIKVINLTSLKRYASIPLTDYFLYRQLRKYYRLHQPDIVIYKLSTS
jgi:hypothetical protein